MSAQIQTARVAGRSVRYLDAGDPAASRVLVLVHAFPVGVHLWGPQLDAFSGWRLIAPALPGFDGSDPVEAASVDGYAAGVLALLDELGVRRAVFGGLSMGGYVVFGVLRQAADRVAGLILADTRSTADTAEARAGRQRMLLTLEEVGPAGVAADMIPKLLGKTRLERRSALVAQVRGMIERQSAEGIGGAVRALMSRPDSTGLLGTIHVPTLLVVGEEDVLTPPADAKLMQAAIPQATLSLVPEAGHLSSLEHPAVFNAAVQAFLARVPSPPPS